MPFAAIALRSASLALVLSSPAFAQDAASPYGPPVSHMSAKGTTTLSSRTDGFDVTFQDLRGVTSRYAFGMDGLLASETAPEIGRIDYGYDDQGRLVRRATQDGLTAHTEYDESGRLLRRAMRENGQDRIVTRYSYDACENGTGKLCRIVHDGHVTRFAYTPEGHIASKAVRLADETQVERLRYEHDTDGRLERMRYPSGLVVRHHYDADGRLTRLTGHYETGEDRERFTVARDIAFDADGRLSGFVHGNGVRTRLRRGDGGALSRITLAKDGTVLDRADLARDGSGRVTAIDRADDARDRRFAYDAGGRLVMETTGDGTPSATTRTDYAYDAVHNRTSRTQGTATRRYTYAPDSNRLTAIGRQSVIYDARGNMIEDRAGRRSFAYDATNRMAAFYRDGELRAEYDYDAQGRRIRKRLHRAAANGVKSVRFVHDREGRLVSEVSRRDDGAAVHARDLVWLNGLPLAQVERNVRSDGTTRQATVLSLHAGHLGEPREARDESGTVVWRWDGDAFGAGELIRDPDGDGISTEVSLRFPGQYHDRESGLFYNHHRDYDPKLGRYVQSDPIGLEGGVNRYAYVSGDPVNFVDPTGLKVSNCRPIPDGVECDYTEDEEEDEGEDEEEEEDYVDEGDGGGGGGGAPKPPSISDVSNLKITINVTPDDIKDDICRAGKAALGALALAPGTNPTLASLTTRLVSVNVSAHIAVAGGGGSIVYAEQGGVGAWGYITTTGVGRGIIDTASAGRMFTNFALGASASLGYHASTTSLLALTDPDGISLGGGRAFFGSFGVSGSLVRGGDEIGVVAGLEVGAGTTDFVAGVQVGALQLCSAN